MKFIPSKCALCEEAFDKETIVMSVNANKTECYAMCMLCAFRSLEEKMSHNCDQCGTKCNPHSNITKCGIFFKEEGVSPSVLCYKCALNEAAKPENTVIGST